MKPKTTSGWVVATAALLIPLLLVLVPSAQMDLSHRSLQMQQGVASYYHDRLQGRRTASGERYDGRKYTAAHKHLPIGTRVRITNLETGKSIMVRINDRGPFVQERVIDLSRRAARDLGILNAGLAPVRVEVVELPDADQT
ncbi:rare lipoprotein A [Thioflavicoccus mobilis 8321]|uniref:Endolytic peptidoglycan transglycosylase RlpA n=1 Tax=Thioflavicoccus mobilis 8321 TaxID=765912 RepID=L0GVA0_9GAMM|nr:septal ring lytic transglycosylase RlpA family protein [Thioflavicoccus mobilis]AGA89911.1 rare lipoprotein A [Thioflavicoccus mobilis 8321]